MRLLGQFQTFLFFLRKDFTRIKGTKSTQRTQANKNKKTPF